MGWLPRDQVSVEASRSYRQWRDRSTIPQRRSGLVVVVIIVVVSGVSACVRDARDARSTRHDTTRHDTTRHDTPTRHDTTRHDTTRHDTTRHDTTRHDTGGGGGLGRCGLEEPSPLASLPRRYPLTTPLCTQGSMQLLCSMLITGCDFNSNVTQLTPRLTFPRLEAKGSCSQHHGGAAWRRVRGTVGAQAAALRHRGILLGDYPLASGIL